MTATVTETPTYPKFRPIPRLHRKVVLTEKVNGTNGLVEIIKVADTKAVENLTDDEKNGIVAFDVNDDPFIVRAGSRNRWITREDDNFGFAQWVSENADALTALGEGKHYGEWFGQGIQSGYGLDEKRFALFNTSRWYDIRDTEVNDNYLATFPKAVPAPPEVTVVPVILVSNGQDLNYSVNIALHTLESEGSFIAPGFKDPEGVVAYHDASGTYFKATIKNDEQPKSKAAAK
jgi:hypothetical protein